MAKLKIATTLLSTNAEAWNYFGLACHRAGQLTNAVKGYQRALELNRNLLEARYNLGCAWLDLSRPDLAKSEFTSYTLRRGNAVEGWLKLGTTQLRTREPAAAEKSFREALRLSPTNTEVLNGLGLVHVQRNRPQDAAQYFSAALKHQPDHRPALLNLAIISQQFLNDQPKALEKYREYLALKPRSPDWEAVNSVAQSLAHQLAPPPRPEATNQSTTALLADKPSAARIPATDLSQTAPPKTNLATATRKPAPSPPPKAKPANIVPTSAIPNMVVQTSALEVVTLPPEPVIRTSLGLPPVSTSTNQQAVAAQPTSVGSPSVAPNQESTTEKTQFLARVNPANLFRREPKPPPNTNAAVELPRERASNLPLTDARSAAPAGAQAIPSTGRRYTYLSPARPRPGNRREAERGFAQGQQAHRANRWAEAAQAYRQATQSDPSYFEAHYNLGLVTYESRSYRQSLAAWENALALQPESVDTRYNFALALKAADYPVDAANELKTILGAKGDETRAHLVLGNLFAEQFDDPAQARLHYLKVLEQDPRHPQATAIRYWLVAHPP